MATTNYYAVLELDDDDEAAEANIVQLFVNGAIRYERPLQIDGEPHDCGSIGVAAEYDCLECLQRYIDDAESTVFQRLATHDDNQECFEYCFHYGLSKGWLNIDAQILWFQHGYTTATEVCCDTRALTKTTVLHKTMSLLLFRTRTWYLFYLDDDWGYPPEQDLVDYDRVMNTLVSRVALLVSHGANTEFACGCTVQSIAKQFTYQPNIMKRCLEACGGGRVTKGAGRRPRPRP